MGKLPEQEFVHFSAQGAEFINYDILNSFSAGKSMLDKGTERLFPNLGPPFVEEFFPCGQSTPLQVILDSKSHVIQGELFAFERDYGINVSKAYKLKKH
jgi:hypothetical protein